MLLQGMGVDMVTGFVLLADAHKHEALMDVGGEGQELATTGVI